MVDNNDDRKDAKRQKLLSEQRSAYEEDMAKINEALKDSHQLTSSAADGEEKNENSEQQQHQQQQQQQQHGGHESDDDEEGAGNWLKNFTPHHTRIGENFQCTNLPTPTPITSHSPPAAEIVPKQ